jgi:hypothetical protein
VLSVPLRRDRLEVLLWAFRLGRPLNADALTAVLGAKHDGVAAPYRQWKQDHVRELLWGDLAGWCAQHELPVPDGVAPTIWTVLDFLHATGCFGRGSDSLRLLREPLVDSGGMRRDGRPRRTPGRGTRARHPSAQHVG